MIRQLLEFYFPFFNDLSEKDKSDLSFYSYTQSFESGQAVLDIQDTCFSLIVVLEGRLRSMLHDFTHPILLYYLNERDICTLASARELFGFSSMITLVADTDCRILKIPSWLYKDLKNRYLHIHPTTEWKEQPNRPDKLWYPRQKYLLTAKGEALCFRQ